MGCHSETSHKMRKEGPVVLSEEWETFFVTCQENDLVYVEVVNPTSQVADIQLEAVPEEAWVVVLVKDD